MRAKPPGPNATIDAAGEQGDAGSDVVAKHVSAKHVSAKHVSAENVGAENVSAERSTGSGDGPSLDDSLDGLLRAAKPDEGSGEAVVHRTQEPRRLLDGRLRVGRSIGSGAMGTVHEAWDGDERVAVKILHRLAATEIYRLKNEFRKLSSVIHPNVVAVRELACDGDEWFFVMEVVDGKPFDRFIRAQSADNMSALRSILRQLVEGVAAVHGSGLLHRDLKPNNVLVDTRGRVVILDFGLVSEQRAGGAGETFEGRISGTPGYMAPEQALGKRALPASDWYAVGVMLFEALTGKLPIRGQLHTLLAAKTSQPPPRASAINPAIPEDLDTLCGQLLQLDAAQRPSTDKLLKLVSAWPLRLTEQPSEASIRRAIPESTTRFVGRAAALSVLEAGFERATDTPSVIWVHGPPGIGKSTLVGQFVIDLERRPRTLVLRGRCYELESVPYKAFDELVDGYTRFLLQLTAEEAARLVPRHAAYAARLFPVLLRVDALRKAVLDSPMSASESEFVQRRKGFIAFKDLIARLGEHHDVVVTIDDMQWADADSIRLMQELLSPPESPSMLLVLSSREDAPPWLEPLSRTGELHLCQLPVSGMSRSDAATLVEAAAEQAMGPAEIDAVLKAASGVPLFLVELAREVAVAGQMPAAPTLPRVFAVRIDALSPAARHLLEIAALSGKPLPLGLAKATEPGARAQQFDGALRQLRDCKLLHSYRGADDTLVEIYHEHVRSAVLARLTPEARRERHGAIARALEMDPNSEPHWLVSQFVAAGDETAAAHHAERAGDQAAQALAFGQAAELYSLALRPGDHPNSAPSTSTLRRKCADALANVGRSLQAAEAYAEAAKWTDEAEAARLRRLACAQWLRAGHLRQGVAELQQACARVGISWPKTVSLAMAGFVANRARIRLAGIKYQLREEAEVPSRLLLMLDTLYPAQTQLGTFDYVRGAYFGSVALPLALKAGEPSRLIQCLGAEAVYGVMLGGTKGEKRADGIRAEVGRLVRRADTPYSRGIRDMAESLTSYWAGHWQRVTKPGLQAESTFEQYVPGSTWEVSLQRSVRHTVDLHGGRLADMGRDVPGQLREAVDRQDRYAQAELTRRQAAVYLAQDRPKAARACLRSVDAQLETTPLASLNHLLLSSWVSLHLYEGQAQTAQRALDAGWAECRKQGLHHFPLLRLMIVGMSADCICGDQSVSDHVRAKALHKLAGRARKEHLGWAAAMADSILASAHRLDGRRHRAEDAHHAAAQGFEDRGMHLTALAERLQLEQLTRSAQAPGTDTCRQDMRSLHVAAPDHWIRQRRSHY